MLFHENDFFMSSLIEFNNYKDRCKSELNLLCIFFENNIFLYKKQFLLLLFKNSNNSMR